MPTAAPLTPERPRENGLIAWPLLPYPGGSGGVSAAAACLLDAFSLCLQPKVVTMCPGPCEPMRTDAGMSGTSQWSGFSGKWRRVAYNSRFLQSA